MAFPANYTAPQGVTLQNVAATINPNYALVIYDQANIASNVTGPMASTALVGNISYVRIGNIVTMSCGGIAPTAGNSHASQMTFTSSTPSGFLPLYNFAEFVAVINNGGGLIPGTFQMATNGTMTVQAAQSNSNVNLSTFASGTGSMFFGAFNVSYSTGF